MLWKYSILFSKTLHSPHLIDLSIKISKGVEGKFLITNFCFSWRIYISLIMFFLFFWDELVFLEIEIIFFQSTGFIAQFFSKGEEFTITKFKFESL